MRLNGPAGEKPAVFHSPERVARRQPRCKRGNERHASLLAVCAAARGWPFGRVGQSASLRDNTGFALFDVAAPHEV
jgi:hypothetical protein